MKLACPNCGQNIKAPDDVAGGYVDCPTCSNRFLTTNAAPFVEKAEEESIEQTILERAEAVRRKADNLTTLAGICFFFFGVSLLFVIIPLVSGDGLPVPALIAAGSFASLGCLFIFLAQLFHIRALLEFNTGK